MSRYSVETDVIFHRKPIYHNEYEMVKRVVYYVVRDGIKLNKGRWFRTEHHARAYMQKLEQRFKGKLKAKGKCV
jgi:peroxiredoxin